MDPSRNSYKYFFIFARPIFPIGLFIENGKKKQIKSYRCDELYNLKTYNENVFNKLQICKTFH